MLLVLNRMFVEGICGHKCNINSPENPFDKNRILCDLRWPWIKSPSHRSMSNVLSIMSRVCDHAFIENENNVGSGIIICYVTNI